ncbi:phosphoglycerate mutase [Neosynechococcus sphagnicola sy1]|uniref:Phosphoglycerate mutase n=1 Tax=Neosynechococcus sphagnicola sy1 TaxID=1497020 RepID=A0A098TN86_9CYAN|nr:phosphoglycerate mutase [Neosynechococcus sphagnicola sy1]
MATRVILVRHGESTYNIEQRVQGHCDQSCLTDHGRKGAQQVGQALQGLALEVIYSSPLQRAQETADIIRSQIQSLPHPPDLHLTDQLKEIHLPLWEGMLFEEVKSQYPEEYRCWQQQPHNLCMQIPSVTGVTDFYPVPAVYDQARKFWLDVLPRHPGVTLLIVAHSGINRALINTAMGLPPDRYQRMNQSNCGISVLNFAGGLGDPVQLESLNLTAHLGDPLPKARPWQGKFPLRLLLVRHGETEWNRQTRFQGQIDVPLNDNGRVQAQQAAEFLKVIPLEAAFSSPMLRPKETAEIILQHHPALSLQLRDGLREISHGLWEGQLESEIEQSFPGQLQQWRDAPETVQMPEGENLQDVWDRAIAAWQVMVNELAAAAQDGSRTALVVAHDATNKVILCHILGVGPESFWSFRQGNGAVSVVDYPQGPQGVPVLQAMNITTHLAGGILDRTAAGAL